MTAVGCEPELGLGVGLVEVYSVDNLDKRTVPRVVQTSSA